MSEGRLLVVFVALVVAIQVLFALMGISFWGGLTEIVAHAAVAIAGWELGRAILRRCRR